MNEILNFIKSHVDLFIIFALDLSILLVALLRKKVKISDIFEMVLTVLPNYIREAELKYDEGTEKYSFVFNKCLELLELLTGLSKQRVVEEYATKIDVAIENILSTPQKKER